VTRATTASSGEQRGEQLTQGLLQALRDVVDVVRDPAEQLAPGLGVEVRQRQPVELRLHVGAELPYAALHDAGEQVALEPGQQAGGEEERRRQGQHPAEPGEVDPHTGDQVHPGQHVGEGVVAGCPRARHRLFLGGPGRQLLADQAGEDDVGRVPEDLRPDDAEPDAAHGEQDDPDEWDPVRPEPAEQPPGGGAEVHRLLHRHPTHEAVPAEGAAAWRRSDRCRCRPGHDSASTVS